MNDGFVNPTRIIGGVSGTFYVAASSGGSPTTLVTVSYGVITGIATPSTVDVLWDFSDSTISGTELILSGVA